MKRREFLFASAGAACALAAGCKPRLGAAADKLTPLPRGSATPHPALYWRADGQSIQCELCPHGCTIEPGKTGFCRTRRNEGGKLVSLTYGQPVTWHNDPIEKKPLNHVLPGSKAFSLATVGCNLTCQHCQNWELSQSSPGDLPPYDWSPAEVARQAKEAGSPTIAFTYNEPTIWSEYILDTLAAAQPLGVRTVMISNGFIREKPQRDLARRLTAYKVDLKGFSEKFYRDICGARLQPVLDGMVRIREEKCWLEIVTLLIPSLNDDRGELKQLAAWVRDNLGPDVPVHFTAFHPMYRLRNLPRTPVETLETARQIALDAGLHYPYVGNVPGHPGAHTYCPNCRTIVIERVAMSSRIVALDNGRCAKCKTAIPGVWA
jgi:pyruvate formate lyase activating enzyme